MERFLKHLGFQGSWLEFERFGRPHDVLLRFSCQWVRGRTRDLEPSHVSIRTQDGDKYLNAPNASCFFLFFFILNLS